MRGARQIADCLNGCAATIRTAALGRSDSWLVGAIPVAVLLVIDPLGAIIQVVVIGAQRGAHLARIEVLLVTVVVNHVP